MENIAQNDSHRGNNFPRILIVDDEPRVLRSMEAALKHKFEIVLAHDATQAQEIMNNPGQFNVIVSDERMPKCPGHVFLKWAKDNHPHNVRILLTGADIGSLQESIKSADVYKCLAKPWDIKKLIEVLDQAVQHSDMLSSQAQNERRSITASRHCAMAVMDLGVTYRDTYRLLGQDIAGIKGVHYFETHEEVMSAMELNLGIGILLIDLSIGKKNAAKLISEMNEKHCYVSNVVTDDPTRIREFTQSFGKSLVFKYITKPMSNNRLQPLVADALEIFFINQAKYRDKMKFRKFDRRKPR